MTGEKIHNPTHAGKTADRTKAFAEKKTYRRKLVTTSTKTTGGRIRNITVSTGKSTNLLSLLTTYAKTRIILTTR
jgi:hypothetical protein